MGRQMSHQCHRVAGNSFDYLKAHFSYQQHFFFLMINNNLNCKRFAVLVLKGVCLCHHWRALHVFTTPIFSLCFSSLFHFSFFDQVNLLLFMHTDNHPVSYFSGANSLQITSKYDQRHCTHVTDPRACDCVLGLFSQLQQ